MQLDEFSMNFEKDLSLVSYISNNTFMVLDIGASCHMKQGHDLFNNVTSGIHVEFGDDAKY
jgi:hypothetical protein